jgi:hypothetical protein
MEATGMLEARRTQGFSKELDMTLRVALKQRKRV